MTLYKWSQTASADATADSTINWAEGQAPSSVNDSARAMMAATAKYRDDIAGAIVTSGTSTAYTVSSYQVFDTLAHLGGQIIAFTPHATNGATVTLNVDALGAKPLRSAPGTELMPGVIIQGTPYMAVYNNTDGAFYLHGYFGSPYNIPLGAGLDYWGGSAPSSSFAFPFGQAISRTTYASLYAVLGNLYGAGDGSTTFNLPDKRGRASAAVDNMGGAAAGRLTAASGMGTGQLSTAGGSEVKTLLRSDLPNVAPTFTGTSSGTDQTNILTYSGAYSPVVSQTGGATAFFQGSPTEQQLSLTPHGSVQSLNGGVMQTNVNGLPPLIICNYIIRII